MLRRFVVLPLGIKPYTDNQAVTTIYLQKYVIYM